MDAIHITTIIVLVAVAASITIITVYLVQLLRELKTTVKDTDKAIKDIVNKGVNKDKAKVKEIAPAKEIVFLKRKNIGAIIAVPASNATRREAVSQFRGKREKIADNAG